MTRISPFSMAWISQGVFIAGILPIAAWILFANDMPPNWIVIFPVVGWIASMILGSNARCPTCGRNAMYNGTFYWFPAYRCTKCDTDLTH